jgi:hypothetical protein
MSEEIGRAARRKRQKHFRKVLKVLEAGHTYRARGLDGKPITITPAGIEDARHVVKYGVLPAWKAEGGGSESSTSSP